MMIVRRLHHHLLPSSSLFLRSISSSSRATKLRELFEDCDINRDGSVSSVDLQNMITKAVPGASLTDKQINDMIDVVDLDNSGTIEFNEWLQWFEGIKDEDISLRSLAEFWTASTGIQEPHIVFHQAWDALMRKDKGNLQFPNEILFLGGAPGSGKGTNTPFIMKERELSGDPIVMSDLLNSPAATKAKAEGGLVGDTEVLGLLLDQLMQPQYREGAVVDGFPRTENQVTCLKLMADKMLEISSQYAGTKDADRFPRPRFRIIVLFVNESEAIRRQLLRGKRAQEHNDNIDKQGLDPSLKVDVRETDKHITTARRRYQIFEEQSASLKTLADVFPYHIINAGGELEEVRQHIKEELSYQSSLELQPDTLHLLSKLPTASDVTSQSRQKLVARLDSYQAQHPDMFTGVIEVIKEKMMPTIKRHAVVGKAKIFVSDAIFSSPLAMQMAVDIFADRHFMTTVEVREKPSGVVYKFSIKFERPIFTRSSD